MTQMMIKKVGEIFSAGWLMVCQLRCGHAIPDGEALYHRACQLITQTGDQLDAAGFGSAAREQMLFALCALLDESVLNRRVDDTAYRLWQQNPLQTRFFSRLDAGETLQATIQELLASPAPDMAVMTCLYHTLQLGFVGGYGDPDDARRKDMLLALAQTVPPLPLSHPLPDIERPYSPRTGQCGYWLSWGAGIAVLVGLWFTFSAILDAQVAQIIIPG